MTRAVIRIILDVVLTILFTLVLLTLWQFFLSGSLADSVGEAARLLFLFMDVGLAVWVILVIVSAVRSRGVGPDLGWTLLFAIIGTLVNLVVVVIVGFVQGGWAPLFVLFAITAGFVFLVAAVVAVLLVHRVIVKPHATA